MRAILVIEVKLGRAALSFSSKTRLNRNEGLRLLRYFFHHVEDGQFHEDEIGDRSLRSRPQQRGRKCLPLSLVLMIPRITR